MADWDYEYLGQCEYTVAVDPSMPVPARSCDEPAIARIMWDDGDEWLVCKEHLEAMLKGEDDD